MRTLTKNKSLVRKIIKAADRNELISMSQMVNFLTTENRKLRSHPQMYIRKTLCIQGYIASIRYGLYRVTQKAKKAVAV